MRRLVRSIYSGESPVSRASFCMISPRLGAGRASPVMSASANSPTANLRDSSTAFAGEKLRRRPALTARGVEPDEIGHGLHIFLDAVELRGRFAGDCAAVARRNRIDEDEIRDVEERCIVVDQLIRRGKQRTGVAHLHAAWTKQAKVQPNGGGTRSAIEAECNWALACIADIIFSISHVEDAGFGRPVFEYQQHGSGRRGVLDLLSAKLQRMLGLNNFFFRNGRLLFIFRLFRGFLRRRLRRLMGETETCPKEKRCGETQKTMRTHHGRQCSFLYPQETKIGDVRHRMRERGHRQSVRSASRGAASPAILIATREITVRMRPTKKACPPRSAECDVLVGPPPFHYFSLLRWPGRRPGARHNKRRKICRTRRPSRNCKRQ